MPTASREIVVTNKLGCTRGRRCSLWMWPTSFSRRSRYQRRREPAEADGKSVMQMIISRPPKARPSIEAEGEDADTAVEKLAELFESKFGEEDEL